MTEIESSELEKTPYQYILVRRDLPIAVQMVQVAHAAGESITEAPISSRTTCVLLHVNDEAHLLAWEQEIKNKGYDYTLIREPDEPYNNQAMSLGLAPSTKRNQLRKVFYHLPAVDFSQSVTLEKGADGAPHRVNPFLQGLTSGVVRLIFVCALITSALIIGYREGRSDGQKGEDREHRSAIEQKADADAFASVASACYDELDRIEGYNVQQLDGKTVHIKGNGYPSERN